MQLRFWSTGRKLYFCLNFFFISPARWNWYPSASAKKTALSLLLIHHAVSNPHGIPCRLYSLTRHLYIELCWIWHYIDNNSEFMSGNWQMSKLNYVSHCLTSETLDVKGMLETEYHFLSVWPFNTILVSQTFWLILKWTSNLMEWWPIPNDWSLPWFHYQTIEYLNWFWNERTIYHNKVMPILNSLINFMINWIPISWYSIHVLMRIKSDANITIISNQNNRIIWKSLNQSLQANN